MKASTKAAKKLLRAMNAGNFERAEDLMGETDCKEGCYVEQDGSCEHGYASAGLTAGAI